MAYEYVRRIYGVDPKVGQRVSCDGLMGKIAPAEGDPQYVEVKFDGRDFTSPCHPTSLDYNPKQP